MKAEQKQDKRRVILIGFILVLVALNVVLIYMIIQNKNSEIDAQKKLRAQQKESYETNLKNLSRRLKQEIDRAKQDGEDNKKYQDSLLSALKDVEEDRNNLKNARNFSQAQIQQYKLKIAAYEELLIQKDSLMRQFKGTIARQREQMTDLRKKNNAVLEQVGKTKEEIQEYKKRFAKAGVLKAENITINRISRRGREKGGGSYRERNIDKLKIYFTLADNKAAKIGQKTVMMLLKDDTGQTLVPAVGGGRFKVKGVETSYTASNSFLFDNSQQTVVFNYTNTNKDLGKGRFTVELYSEGERIGTGSFTVR